MADANVVNKATLSRILGVSERSLTDWQKEEPPLPVIYAGDRGEANEYDTVEVIRWVVDRALRKAQVETPRDRLARVQADMVELELAEKRRDLIPGSEIEPAWAAQMVEVRQAFRAMPANIVPLLAHMDSDADAMRAALDDTVDDILTRLAGDDRGIAGDPAEGARATRAPSAAASVGVG